MGMELMAYVVMAGSEIGMELMAYVVMAGSEMGMELLAYVVMAGAEMGMEFSINACKRAMFNSGNNAEAAMNWLFEHMGQVMAHTVMAYVLMANTHGTYSWPM